MKKYICLLCVISFFFLLSGCGPLDSISRYLTVGDVPVQDQTERKPRVYMDEIKGVLCDFSGDSLTILSQETQYTFDLSRASLECENGMITGDEVTVIYEGQLSETGSEPDTSQVTVLKVVNDYRMHIEPEENTVSGQLQELSPNRITLKLGDGKRITFPTTGCRQYFSSGIQKNMTVTVHYLGSQESAVSDDEQSYNANHVKPLSASDVEPFSAPEYNVPTEEESMAMQTFQGTIRDLQMNLLSIKVSGVKKALSLDLSEVPASFPGGPMPGSKVFVSYQGEWNGTTLEGITPVSVFGEDPTQIKEYNMNYSVTGNVRGGTKNTITILSTDGVFVTFRTDHMTDNSTGSLEIGTDIRIVFNPEENRETNVFSALRMEDA